MDFSEYQDINDFYQKTGMTPIETYNFLHNECKKRGLI